MLLNRSDNHLLGFVRASPERREDAVGPVVGGDVEPAEHLRRCDRLGVHPHLLVNGAALRQCPHQHADALGFPGTGRAERHHAVPDQLGLVELDQFQQPGAVMHQTRLAHLPRRIDSHAHLHTVARPELRSHRIRYRAAPRGSLHHFRCRPKASFASYELNWQN